MEQADKNKMVVVGLVIGLMICLMLLGRSPQPSAQSSQLLQSEEPSQSAERAAAEPSSGSFEKFIVYQDKPSANHYIPSGFMPDGKCVSIDDAWTDNCQEGRSCIKAVFDGACSIKGMGWAGVYWLDPANNWGDETGGFDLTGAQKLVFWARSQQGGELVTFKVGGVGMGHAFHDSDMANLGPVALTKEWARYSIDLKGKDLTQIIGGFAWVASANANPQGAVFYLDDIHYE